MSEMVKYEIFVKNCEIELVGHTVGILGKFFLAKQNYLQKNSFVLIEC